MQGWRDTAIAAGFATFRATGLHRLLAPWTRGRGAILMFHHVRPNGSEAFAPNRVLEITPEFLESVIVLLRARNFEIVSLDTALARLAAQKQPGEKPFAVLTFDDGYRDNRDFALPVLRRHQAPFALYVTTGFAERSARLWWRELEAAVRRLDVIECDGPAGPLRLAAQTDAQKSRAFDTIYWQLRGQGEDVLLATIARLCGDAGVDAKALVAQACMDWDEIETIAREPLCTIGVHTLSHPRLAKLSLEAARQEMAESRAIITARIGRPARHFSYPVGDATSAGAREFQLASQTGFASAVTTRPGMVLQAHAARALALPRLSVNGKWQQLEMMDVLLSGAPFALLNRGRAA